MQKIVTNLWFDQEAEEAAKLYTSLFESSRIVEILRYGESGKREAGTVMTVTFELQGQTFTAINGGPQYRFTEAISLLINCESQEEIDTLWEKLSEGGEKGPCGWLKDRYGLSWQITPRVLQEMIADSDPARAERVMAAMLKMQKLDIEGLQRAYDG